jgi:hypothetical protein
VSDPLIALAARRAELVALAEMTDCQTTLDTIHDERANLELKMLAVPAQSVAGVLAKARILAEYQLGELYCVGLDTMKVPAIEQAYALGCLDEWAFSYSVWADLERLAGGAA